MDFATLGGLIVGIIILVIVLIMDGGSPAELFAHPSAIILIWGGSLMATMIQMPLKTMMNLPKLLGIAMKEKHYKSAEAIELIVRLADKARRDGLLALEEEVKKIDDPFLQRGIMMVVDGVDPAQVRAILETSINQMKARHKMGIGMFAAAGGFAPTFGIIGTVMGLISVLKALDNPSALAASIAGAFLATLWGLLSSNLIFLPIGGKLKVKSEEEAHYYHLLVEGIASLQAGENPRIVREKLNAYLPPKAAVTEDGAGKDAKKAGAAKPAAEKA